MVILGWILLGILLFLLSVILLILFFPVAYRLTLCFREGSPSVRARLSWLFSFLVVAYDYPDPGEPAIRIFHIPIKLKNKKPPSEDAEASAENNKKTDTAADQPIKQADKAFVSSQEESLKSQAPSSSDKAKPIGESDNTPGREEKQKPSFLEKTSAKLESLKRDLEFYRKLWEHELTQQVKSDLIASLLKIWKNICPRKISGRLTFGGKTPDTTGYALAVYSILSTQLPRRISLDFTADFENEILDGEVLIRGRITLFVLGWNILKFVLNKRVKAIRRRIEKHRSKQ